MKFRGRLLSFGAGAGIAALGFAGCAVASPIGETATPTGAASSPAAQATNSATSVAPAPTTTAPTAPVLPTTTSTPTPVATDTPVATPAAPFTLEFSRWSYNAQIQTVSAAAFLPVRIDAQGTCTLSATGPGVPPASVITQATPDATTTVCAAELSGTDLATGVWTLTMTYSDPTGTTATASEALVVE